MSAETNQPRSGRPPRLQIPAGPIPAGAITKAEFARLLGCAKSRVTEWVRQRTLTEPAVTSTGLIAPSLAVEQLTAAGAFAVTAAPARQPAPAPLSAVTTGAVMTYDEARTATETLKAHRALLDLRERRAELVETATAEGVLFAATRAFRDGLTTWPVRVVPEMAARLGVPPAVLLTEMERALRDFLGSLADPRADWRQDVRR